jgi:hypothetical protein
MTGQLVSLDVPPPRAGSQSRSEDWLDAVRFMATLGVAFPPAPRASREG